MAQSREAMGGSDRDSVFRYYMDAVDEYISLWQASSELVARWELMAGGNQYSVRNPAVMWLARARWFLRMMTEKLDVLCPCFARYQREDLVNAVGRDTWFRLARLTVMLLGLEVDVAWDESSLAFDLSPFIEVADEATMLNDPSSPGLDAVGPMHVNRALCALTGASVPLLHYQVSDERLFLSDVLPQTMIPFLSLIEAGIPLTPQYSPLRYVEGMHTPGQCLLCDWLRERLDGELDQDMAAWVRGLHAH